MPSTPDADPTQWSATEIAASVRERAVSIPEVAERHLERIAETAALNALAWFDPDRVRWAASTAQARLDRGEPAGVLEGVPFTVKDVIATAGLPTSAGCRPLSENRPRRDATAVARILGSGGILLGKTNCPEFAFSILTDSPLHGRTTSPWGCDLSPGGSSGGESALLAAGASALGLGTDFGGSLRWPAHCTGVLALRPTAGRVPATGQIPGVGGSVGREDVLPNPATLQGRLQVIGPIARTVRDLEVALSVLSGEDGLDPTCAPRSAAPLARKNLRGLRFGWCLGDQEIPCSSDVQQVVEAVAAGLRGVGLVDVFMPGLLRGGRERYDGLRDLDTLAEIRLAVGGSERRLGVGTRQLLERPSVVDAGELSSAWRRALEWRVWFVEQLREAPVMIAPVAPGAATGHDGALVVDGRRLGPWDLMAYCRAVSLTGLPVVSIPCGASERGLPLSVQVVGRPFHDEEVLSVARLLERLFGGARLPPRRDVRAPWVPDSLDTGSTFVDDRRRGMEGRCHG
jgi:amidase